MRTERELNKTFSIKELIASSWNLTYKNFGKLLPIMLVAALVYVLISVLSVAFIKPIADGLEQLPIYIAASILAIGVINVCFKVCSNQEVFVKDLFYRSRLLLNYIVMSILQWIAVAIGLVLLVIPGLIVAARLGLAAYPLVDKELGPIESLKRSWVLVKGCTWRVFFFLIVLTLIDIAGFLVFIVGILFTLPMTVIACVLLYRQLERQTFETELVKVDENLPPTTL